MGGDFFNLTRGELEARLTAEGYPAVHAKDLFRRAYKAHTAVPWEGGGAGSLPRALVTALGTELRAVPPRLAEEQLSGYDGSVKFLVELDDGARVEAVLMPEKQRITLCVSSQVGCAQACVFCHTGRMGLTRQLTAGEIVGQLVAADRWIIDHPEWLATARLPATQRVTNVVFMGMGEPLDNVEAVAKAHRIFTDPYGLALGAARISVSTAGHLEGIERMVAAVPDVRLALSVHTTDDAQRSKLMPINKRWPLETVVDRLAELMGGVKGRPVLLQYTLIKGVNDALADAERLGSLAAKLNAKVNLIPFNEVGPSRLAAPSPEVIQSFRDVLHAAGLRVLVRYSKGQDIAAACGQLVIGKGKPTRSLPASEALAEA